MTSAQASSNTTVHNGFFGNLGRSFQEKVIQALLTDRIWATSFLEVFNLDECVEPAYLKLVASKYLNYYASYKEFPTLELLLTIIRDDLSNGADLVLRQQCHEFLQKVVRN